MKTQTQAANQSSAKRVLIYRLGSLGDTIVALPSFHLIERSFPNAERRLLTNIPVASKAAPAMAVLEGSGLVHSVMEYHVRERNLAQLLELRRKVREWKPDVLIYFAGYRGMGSLLRDWIFFRSCGIPRLVGFPFAKDLHFAHKLPGSNEYERAAAWLARGLRELGAPDLDDRTNWDLRLTTAERAKAAEILAPAGERPMLAISIGTKDQAKDWGIDNWKALMAKLAAEYPTHVLVLIGAAVERQLSEAAAAAWLAYAPEGARPMVINQCGELTPRESAAVLERAQLFLGLDSGPMHLAAAMGTQCVAIFSARQLPAVWFPYGKGHHVLYHAVDCMGCKLETCIEQKKKCILSITVEEVQAAVREAIRSTKNSTKNSLPVLQ